MNTVKKALQKRQLGLLALLLMAVPFWSKPGAAVQFNQTELSNPEDFVVVAAPAGRIGYGLLILEQVKDDRPCWAEVETGTGFTAIDPLLTEFDFTGICGRSIDSNAYSLRTANQDLGLQYSLRVLQQGNELVLVAAANGLRNVFIPIGRTFGLPQPGQFAEIQLDPGWRLSRRTFNGRSTGHLYLTSDQPISVLLAAANAPTSTAGPITPPLRPNLQTPTNPSSAPLLPPPGSTSPLTESPTPSNPAGAATPATPIQIPVPPPDSSRAADNSSSTPPAAPPATTSTALPPLPPRPAAGSSVAPVPAAPPASTAANSAPPASSTATNPPAPIAAAPPSPAANSAPPIAAPSSPAPSAPLPQPPQRQATGIVLGYRVIVAADSAELIDRVRSLAPQTQIVTVNGQPAVQAGLFRDLNSAEQMRQRLEGENLSVTIVPIR